MPRGSKLTSVFYPVVGTAPTRSVTWTVTPDSDPTKPASPKAKMPLSDPIRQYPPVSAVWTIPMTGWVGDTCRHGSVPGDGFLALPKG
jgi:hypothetical protein